METRTCVDCGIASPATTEFFHKKKSGLYGLRSDCKDCRKKQARERYQQNREKILGQIRIWAKENPEKVKECNKRWQSENRARLREYKNRRNEDPVIRIAQNLRNGIRRVLNGTYKSSSSMDLLGCTVEECKKHLEDQFQEGMSWDTYGFYGWHIDHIRPCSSFDLIQEDQQRVCFNYKNLQPLWAAENLSKGNRWEGEE